MSIKAAAFKYNDKDILSKSSSGGAFSAFSQYVLDNNGIVFGAIYDYDTDTACHINASKYSDRDKMRGSKYFQSKIGNTFQDVKKELSNQKQVLFVGTICQISGLYNFLSEQHIDTKNLICCDIICHGVASPLIWKDYINYEKRENNIINIESVSFRDKLNGWTSSHSIIKADNKTYEIPEFMRLFYSHTIMRPSCHSCKFASFDRVSDITIGDFWGIEKSMPEFNRDDGVSYVLINSKKGQIFFDSVLNAIDNIIYRECKETDVDQPNFYHPTKKSIIRDRVWRDYKTKGIAYIIKEYASNSKLVNSRIVIKKVIDTIKAKIVNEK